METARPSGAPGIGRALESVRHELISIAAELENATVPSAQQLVSESAALLRRQNYRMAVIGQIKSGKSTFVNALVQQPELLPTNVNPWTTAVTRLHFNAVPEKLSDPDPKTGRPPQARFTFFTDGEWQRIADGGGRLRELTERLVPGFEPVLLRKQIEALQRRAAERLGDSYPKLLGQTHTFDRVDHDVLKQYVCAGLSGQDIASGNASEPSPIGRFSDITKTADIRCEKGPFRFPVTVMDTPGTNDPFMLRDEITRRALEAADVYIVVLTARQPLSEADLALLRILRGLHKDRIVIFINRIDDLGDIANDLPKVKSFVRDRVAQEFPGSSIPIVSGSARWGASALRDDVALAESLDDKTIAFMSAAGLLPPDELRSYRGDAETRTPERRAKIVRAMFAASGIPAVYKALARNLDDSHSAHVIRQVAQCFSEMVHSDRQGLASSVEGLEPQHAQDEEAAAKAGGELQRLDKEIAQLQQVSDIIEQSSRNIEIQLNGILDEELGEMASLLGRQVDRHAAHERAVVADTLRRGPGPSEWRCESIELRKSLAGIFHTIFDRASYRVSDLNARVTPELQQLTRLIAPTNQPPPPPVGTHLRVPMPSLAPLSASIALDLDVPFWKAWFSRRPSADQRAAEVERLIKDEFTEVIEGLVASARRALEEYCDTARRWSFGVCSSLVDALQDRRETLRTDMARIRDTVGDPPDQKTLAVRAEHLSALRKRLQRADELAERLQGVSETLAAIHDAQASGAGPFSPQPVARSGEASSRASGEREEIEQGREQKSG